MNIDPTGCWSWSVFWEGLGLAFTSIAAIAISIATFGAGTPLAMGIVAGITLGTGILTGVNAAANLIEAGIGYNFVRDGIFAGNSTAYNWYAGITAGIAAVGTMVLGVYQNTGQFKAAKAGRNFLGKNYIKQEKGRWVSKDGLRQLRLDKSGHYFKNIKLGVHFNLDSFKTNYWLTGHAKIKSTIHQLYSGFKTWFF